MTAAKKSAKAKDEASLKDRVLLAALAHAGGDGFVDRTLTRAGTEAGIGCEAMLHLFPDGPASLVAHFSAWADGRMERALSRRKLSEMKIRERIREAALARIGVLRPHKDAARRAAAFLLTPNHAALGARLLYDTADAMWRLAGDASTDFNFYTKRAILMGVYSSTMMRWFNDADADEEATRAFLDARIENVMQFEKFKAELRERTKDWPTFSDAFKGFGSQKS
ncbi:MAG TPA: COQ9 family protein [Rhizomicrobium sp.]|jgi:ubiquinone biosynthesis protein COQ9|nr:COQ9 family protein [Rhizomicrobium sp.]